MIIVYSPEGGDVHRWDLKDVRIMAVEAEEVERVTDLDWAAARAKIVKGSMLALRAVAFVLLKREQPTLRYGQFNPAAAELDFDYSADERAAIRAAIEADPDISEEERAATLAEFAALDATLADAETAADEETPDAEDSEAVPKDSDAGASPTAA
ncbi:hypothetical protein ACIBCS_27770 [Streptomyces phaeochromogenes]|uniref:hypothetical protein n=1 Tax=Streptomyces phaeochromogenes TaxID=1923 RepID=UPI0033C9820D